MYVRVNNCVQLGVSLSRKMVPKHQFWSKSTILFEITFFNKFDFAK